MHKNVTYAFVDILGRIRKEGSPALTRGQQQLEILSQLIQIERPLERVIVTPHRNNNIFALIAETFWVLGGRNDLAYLSHYLPRAADFSDDGKTWRAAYGPRLRNWRGVDQFQEVISLLRKDPSSKRAVMTIFDPQLDFVETKDVPCNNWLHFMIRDGRLHLNVTVRANDAIWGFGGINFFQWSILQEMMAFWTGSKVGTLSWFVGTIHIYERHRERAAHILENFGQKTVYDFGAENPKFGTAFPAFDGKLKKWFDLEARMRDGAAGLSLSDCAVFEDPLLDVSAGLLFIYNRHLQGAAAQEIVDLLVEIPPCDFKLSAMEFFARQYKNENLFAALPDGKEFFDFYKSVL